MGSPKDLVTSDVTDTSFAVSWTAAPGNMKMYRLRWKSLFSEESGEKTVPGTTTSTVLEGLTPETLYQVSVFASYGRGDGEPLTGTETTDGMATSCVFGLLLAVAKAWGLNTACLTPLWSKGSRQFLLYGQALQVETLQIIVVKGLLFSSMKVENRLSNCYMSVIFSRQNDWGEKI